MNKEKQRVAIAEACGWTSIFYNYVSGEWMGHRPNEDHTPHPIPDYLNDLNAARDLLKFVPDRNLFRHFLYLVILDDPTNTENETAFATAAQWSEAFLKTLGLWTE